MESVTLGSSSNRSAEQQYCQTFIAKLYNLICWRHRINAHLLITKQSFFGIITVSSTLIVDLLFSSKSVVLPETPDSSFYKIVTASWWCQLPELVSGGETYRPGAVVVCIRGESGAAGQLQACRGLQGAADGTVEAVAGQQDVPKVLLDVAEAALLRRRDAARRVRERQLRCTAARLRCRDRGGRVHAASCSRASREMALKKGTGAASKHILWTMSGSWA